MKRRDQPKTERQIAEPAPLLPHNEAANERQQRIIARLIRSYMAAAGLSTTELARRLGVTSNLVSRWRWGRAVPRPLTLEQVVKICEAEAER